MGLTSAAALPGAPVLYAATETLPGQDHLDYGAQRTVMSSEATTVSPATRQAVGQQTVTFFSSGQPTPLPESAVGR
jgi:hypothetical protein